MNSIVYLLTMISSYFITAIFGNLLSIETCEEQNFFNKYLKKMKNPLFYMMILYTAFLLRNSIFNLIIYIFIIIILHIMVLKLNINLIVPCIIITYSFSIVFKDYYGIIFNLIYVLLYYSYTTSKYILRYAKIKNIKLETDTKFKGNYKKILFNNLSNFKVYYLFFIFSILLYFT